jgi:hypothetical protein
MLLTISCTLVGAAILALTYFDIWATVLHPGIESPLSNRFHRLSWRLLGVGSRALPRSAGLLHAALPLLVAGLISLWLLLLLGGFALLYYPWLGDPAAFDTPPDVTGTRFDALYVSGTTLFTLGYGDITPLTKWLRTLALLEAGSGMATVALAVAYVLAVYPTLSRLNIRATALDAEVAGQVSGLPLLRRYLLADGHWNSGLEDRLRELALELLELTENHEAHPILYYSHPPRVQQSILRMLLIVQRLIGLLRYGLSPERHADLVRNPQVLLLEQSFSYSLRRLAVSLHTAAAARDGEAATREDYAASFARLCADLEGLGLVSARQGRAHPVSVLAQGAQHPDLADAGGEVRPPAAGPGTNGRHAAHDPALDLAAASPVDAYVAFRRATDPHLAAYARASGYRIAEVLRGDDAIWGHGGDSGDR